MKVIILAGGLGTRLSEYTKKIPKPMVKIKSEPIIYYIIKSYLKYGFKDFIIALGYKGNVIKKYFKKKKLKAKIELIETGLNTMTGGRLKRLEELVEKKRFLLTYGDGVSNVNIKNLILFHKKNKNLVTLTAVRPPARFGGIKVTGKKVKYFKEKSRLDEGWINGGFFVMEPEIFKYLNGDSTILERYPLEKMCKIKKLGAFKHHGFWQCMDTLRDKEILEENIHKIKK